MAQCVWVMTAEKALQPASVWHFIVILRSCGTFSWLLVDMNNWFWRLWICHFSDSETLPVPAFVHQIGPPKSDTWCDWNRSFWCIRIRVLCVFICLSIRLWHIVIHKAERHFRSSSIERHVLSETYSSSFASTSSGKEQTTVLDHYTVSFAAIGFVYSSHRIRDREWSTSVRQSCEVTGPLAIDQSCNGSYHV